MPEPRYWVLATEVSERIHGKRTGLLAFKDVTSPTNERTSIACILPTVGAGHKLPLVYPDGGSPAAAFIAAVANALCYDYVVRQKLGGVSLTYFVVRQIPVPAPEHAETIFGMVIPRVLELTYTAADLASLAADLGYTGPPFRWDPDRRALIRAELDALMFRLYGIERKDVDYILESFPIVRRKDEQRFGEFRTKRLILERYDALTAAVAAGVPYESPLDPPPGDKRAAHPVPTASTA